MSFREYLQKEKYHLNTIRQYERHIQFFFKWTEQEKREPQALTYTHILHFIEYSKAQKQNIPQINRILKTISTWYKYQSIITSPTTPCYDPVKNLRLKGTPQTLPANLLTKETLTTLYQQYHPYDSRTHRNKVILSLLITQAITTEELHALTPEHIRLREGKIHIPQTSNGKKRTLPLEAHQVISLQEYLTIYRPQLLREIKAYRPGRKPKQINHEQIQSRLFFSESGSPNIKGSLRHLFKAIKKINPQIQSAQQIRQSIIVSWLKEKDLRNVQYMAGHGHILSTEKYKQLDTSQLQEALNQYHPQQ